jgi:hypothetical protein
MWLAIVMLDGFVMLICAVALVYSVDATEPLSRLAIAAAILAFASSLSTVVAVSVPRVRWLTTWALVPNYVLVLFECGLTELYHPHGFWASLALMLVGGANLYALRTAA